MNLTSERKLKFDRRLRGRLDFVSDAELEVELESLPDAADKALGPDEDARPTLKAVAAPPPAAVPAPSAPEVAREPAASFETQSFGGNEPEGAL